MKHYRLMILALLLTIVCRTMADNLTVETVKMSAGGTKQLAIVLNNPTNKYAAFQFDLVLPDGISIAKNAKGKLIASLDEDRKDDHTLNVSETGTNTYRFLLLYKPTKTLAGAIKRQPSNHRYSLRSVEINTNGVILLLLWKSVVDLLS